MDKDDKTPQTEDYGSPGTDFVRTSIGGSGGMGDRTDDDITPLSNTEGSSANAPAERGSDDTANQGSNRGERFGEFEDTGVGTDLTIEMENTDVRSGEIKGGQHGASDAAGPGQYGGEAGSVSDKPQH